MGMFIGGVPGKNPDGETIEVNTDGLLEINPDVLDVTTVLGSTGLISGVASYTDTTSVNTPTAQFNGQECLIEASASWGGNTSVSIGMRTFNATDNVAIETGPSEIATVNGGTVAFSFVKKITLGNAGTTKSIKLQHIMSSASGSYRIFAPRITCRLLPKVGA